MYYLVVLHAVLYRLMQHVVCAPPCPQARQLDEEELKPKNAKRMRIQHTINISSKMPRNFSVQMPQEVKVLNYVQVGAKGRAGVGWGWCCVDVIGEGGGPRSCGGGEGRRGIRPLSYVGRISLWV